MYFKFSVKRKCLKLVNFCFPKFYEFVLVDMMLNINFVNRKSKYETKN